MKNIKIFFAVLLSSIFLFFLQNDAQASMCSLPGQTYIAICENNVCKEGFGIYYDFEEAYGCVQVPKVKENVLNLDEMFRLVFYENNIQNARGIYEISFRPRYDCSSDYYLENKDNWIRNCADGATVIQLSASTTSLEHLNSYKSYWLSKEAEERKIAEKDKQKTILASTIIAILIVGWPLLFVAIIMAIAPLRRRLNLTALLVVALIFQLGFLIFQSIIFSFSYITYPEVYLIEDITFKAILLSIILEVFFLIFRIGKRLFHRAR